MSELIDTYYIGSQTSDNNRHIQQNGAQRVDGAQLSVRTVSSAVSVPFLALYSYKLQVTPLARGGERSGRCHWSSLRLEFNSGRAAFPLAPIINKQTPESLFTSKEILSTARQTTQKKVTMVVQSRGPCTNHEAYSMGHAEKGGRKKSQHETIRNCSAPVADEYEEKMTACGLLLVRSNRPQQRVWLNRPMAPRPSTRRAVAKLHQPDPHRGHVPTHTHAYTTRCPGHVRSAWIEHGTAYGLRWDEIRSRRITRFEVEKASRAVESCRLQASIKHRCEQTDNKQRYSTNHLRLFRARSLSNRDPSRHR
ncbi:hypothetical protein V8C35DRAFT_39909 [Trichoderma chlorosporum]